jgi:hypothetical protein
MEAHSKRARASTFSRLTSTGPFFKALLISFIIELAVLLITGRALGSSMMRHSAAAPRPAGEDLLATLGIIFHFPSLLILTPFELFIFAPLLQIALMTCLLGFVFRARRNRQKPPLSFLT